MRPSLIIWSPETSDFALGSEATGNSAQNKGAA